MAVLLLMTVTIWGQNTVMSKKCMYNKNNYWTECKISRTDGKYFIHLNLFKVSKNVMEVGDQFQIFSRSENIVLTVTQDIFEKMDEKGYVSFPLEKHTVESISRSKINFYLVQVGSEPLKYDAWDVGLNFLAKSVLNGETEEPGKKIYPSWRD